MMSSKTTEYGGLFAFIGFIVLILVIFYNYLATPNFKPLPFMVVFMLIMVDFFMNHGEIVGRYMKRKNFQTSGGICGVYIKKINLPNGLVEYFFTTQKRYAEFVGYEDFKERNWMERFLTRWTNTRIMSVIDYPYMFEEVQEQDSDTDEGCVKYYGTLRRGSVITSPMQKLQMQLKNAYAIISEITTIAEKAKATSEQSAQTQSKDIIDAVIKVGTAIQQLPTTQSGMNPQQFRSGGN